MKICIKLIVLNILLLISITSIAQNVLSGKVVDAETGNPIFAANVLIEGTIIGTTTDFDGLFELTVESLPITLSTSYLGYKTKTTVVSSENQTLTIKLDPNSIVLKGAEIVGQRISDKQKQEALTVETMDVIAIKEAPSGNFYEGLGNLKDVDLTSASLGFKIINTRGFNSTSPVRSLQLIDGVDNQSPGLNFSLGNFLGASDLDVMRVNIVAGASSAFYGPGAFNGVINMTTKDPFLFPGVSMSFKKGERGLYERAIRIANTIKNKDGVEKFGFKINLFTLEANDWKAKNYGPLFQAEHDETNPYGFDAVNIYGDEATAGNNNVLDDPFNKTGLGIFYRNGYKEEDLVDYTTDNFKFNTGLYYRFQEDLTLNYSFSYSTGSTVYQGDNRYRLDNIEFFQHKIELEKKDKWFIRAYRTREDAGDTYDIVTTAIRLQDASGQTIDWNTRFIASWRDNFTDLVKDEPRYDEIFQQVGSSGLDAEAQLDLFNELLLEWYFEDYDYFNDLYLQNIDLVNSTETADINPFYAPGTTRFDSLFNDIKARTFTQGGSRFFDESQLYHVQGEYKFDLDFADVVVGGNIRWYRPDSQGTIFEDTLSYVYQFDSLGNVVLDEQGRRVKLDSSRVVITNSEWGIYTGIEKSFLEDDKLKANVTVRMDKNQNFDFLFSPAASFVYTRDKNTVFRMTFSSAIRNPTLADQYLYYNVGRAILLGNNEGRFEAGSDSLFTLESFRNYRNSPSLVQGFSELEFFNVDKIRPEKVKTIEGGFRGTWFDNTFFDLAAYYSEYTDFIGYNIGLNARFDENTGFPVGNIQVFRVAANAKEKVTTTGFSAGVNYYFDKFTVNGNYSFNRLISGEDDPIIPAFNTPKNKFNLGISGRNFPLKNSGLTLSFGANYKWIQGFLFEGSPQFTGYVPSYDMIDAQVSLTVPDIHCTFKFGGSNIMGVKPFFDKSLGSFKEKSERAFNNLNLQVYGGPLVGRILYMSVLFEIK